MNIIECQNLAKSTGAFNTLKFTAMFPSGLFSCRWLDAYFGFIAIEGIDGFVSIDDLRNGLGDNFFKVVCIVPGADNTEEPDGER